MEWRFAARNLQKVPPVEGRGVRWLVGSVRYPTFHSRISLEKVGWSSTSIRRAEVATGVEPRGFHASLAAASGMGWGGVAILESGVAAMAWRVRRHAGMIIQWRTCPSDADERDLFLPVRGATVAEDFVEPPIGGPRRRASARNP